MKKIGIQLNIRAVDSAVLMQQAHAGNFDSAYLAWQLDADPIRTRCFTAPTSPPRGQNFVLYSNPEADRLIDDAHRELDASKRKNRYWRFHEVLTDDQPYTWTVQVSMKWRLNKRLHGVAISPGHGLSLSGIRVMQREAHRHLWSWCRWNLLIILRPDATKDILDFLDDANDTFAWVDAEVAIFPRRSVCGR